MELKCLPFDMKAASADGTFEGIANAFHTIDAAGEIVTLGAFEDALPAFLANGFIGGLNHDWDSPIGKPLAASETARGLVIKAKVSDTTNGRDVLTLLRDGVIHSLSIGYGVKGKQIIDNPEGVQAYWEQHSYSPTAQDVARSQSGAILLTKISPLYEVSPVTVPANDFARITAVKRLIWTPNDADKAVSGSTTLPLAGRDMQWDAAAADKRVRAWAGAEDAPNAKYRRAFFWYDASAPEDFGSYKLGYADVVDGELKAMPRGIFACMGGRGVDAADIPDADKSAIKRKIARYYARMREEFDDETIQMPGMGKAIDFTNLADAEGYLRDAGSLTRTEAKRFISVLKPLLRDAVGESETTEELDQEAAIETKAEEEASETPAETEPVIPPQPPEIAVPPDPASATPPSILAQQRRLADTLYQQFICEQARPFAPRTGAP